MTLDLRSINKCVSCGSCRSVCPVFEELGWESTSARGRMILAKKIGEGFVDRSFSKSLNTCTTCGLCTFNCPAGADPPRIVEQARSVLTASGITTPELSRLYNAVIKTSNSLGDTTPRLAWLEKPIVNLEAEAVYFVGCLDSYRYTKTASRTFDILSKLNVTLLPDEVCCGSPLIRTGFDASRFMDHNLAQLEEMGIDTVITGCAGCYTTLKNDYPKSLTVLSVPEFLDRHLGELDLKRLDMTVTYHDPCHLGRMNGIFEEPRRIIRAISDLKEMKANRMAARCCGGGGGVRAGYRDLSLKMAERRLKDVPSGVDCIVTCCPLCVRNLNDAKGKAIDLVDLVSMSLSK